MNVYEILLQYNKLNIFINYFLLITPIMMLIFNRKYLYCLYAISIVSNLPLIFVNYFNFSYELYLGLLIILSIIKELIFNREVTLILNKESLSLVLLLIILMVIHLIISLINFNQGAYIETFLAYFANILVLFYFGYFIKNSYRKNLIIKSVFIGGVILAISILIELYINYYHLNNLHGRYGGLIIDPNGAALVLNLCLVLSFYQERYYKSFNSVIRYICRIIIFAGIIATASRSGFISLLVICLYLIGYYLAIKKEAYKAYALVFVIGAGVLIFRDVVINFMIELMKMVDLKRISDILLPTNHHQNNPSNGLPPVVMDPATSGRWQLMLNSIQVLKNFFLIGVGIGNVPSQIDPTNLMNSHNLWLQLFLESGILMVISVGVFVIYLIKYIFNRLFKNKALFILLLLVLFIETFFNHNLLKLNITVLLLAIIITSNILSLPTRTKYQITWPFKFSKSTQTRLNFKNLEEQDYRYQFSIITPTFNRGKMLGKLYRSLLLQTDANFEWIVINDGSTDNTIEIINSFAFENKISIVLINQNNLGKHNALNSGIAAAQGKYILIVDSDDYLPSNSLENLQKMFYYSLKYDENICGVAGLKADENKNVVGKFPLFRNKIVSNNIERERLRLTKDKAECFYSTILQQYKFASFNNETFLTERILWDELADDGYYIGYYKRIVYYCEYQPDGLSAQGGVNLLNNPLGYAHFIKNILKYDYPLRFRIYHLGSYTNTMLKYYDVTLQDLATATNANILELWVYSKFHKIIKRIFRNKDES